MKVNLQNQSPLDEEPLFSLIRDLICNGETNSSIANKISEKYRPTSRQSIQRFRNRHMLGVPTSTKTSVKVEGDDATINTPALSGNYRHMDDPDAMLEERGLDPQEWTIDGATVNEWDGPQQGGSVVTYHQAKLVLKRKKPELSILPARTDGYKFANPQNSISGYKNKSKLIAVVGDQQAPFQDDILHNLFCEWLEDNIPDEGISLGDGVDFPDISRHRLDPENTAAVNECIQKGYEIFRDYREASLDTRWQFLPGNHDERIRNILLDKPSSRPLYGLKRADTNREEGEPVIAIPHLLRFDELQIEYVDPRGPYEMAQVKIGDKLAVRHGWLARQGSGSTALATLEHLGHSVIIGHVHRQSLVYHTTYDINGEMTTLVAAEAGCMCRIDQVSAGRKWPAYTPCPDWTQGFSTVELHDNGYFRIDNATYVRSKGKGALLWRDQCYSA